MRVKYELDFLEEVTISLVSDSDTTLLRSAERTHRLTVRQVREYKTDKLTSRHTDRLQASKLE